MSLSLVAGIQVPTVWQLLFAKDARVSFNSVSIQNCLTARTSDNMWPAYPNVFTLEYAYEEAEAKFGEDPRQYSIQTKKIVADENGNVKELHTIQMEK